MTEDRHLPEDFTPLELVGLDATICQRGVRIFPNGDSTFPDAPVENWTVRTFRPIHPPRYPE